jgi:hypothetical protein
VVKRVEFVNDRMSYITLKGCWHDVIVMNVHVPTEDEDDDIKDGLYKELKRVFDQLHRYHMKILLGDFNAEVGKEDIFKLMIGNENLHEVSNDNGVRVVNFTITENLIVRSTTLPHHIIHNHTGTSHGVTHNQIDHVLINKRHLNALDV